MFLFGCCRRGEKERPLERARSNVSRIQEPDDREGARGRSRSFLSLGSSKLPSSSVPDSSLFLRVRLGSLQGRALQWRVDVMLSLPPSSACVISHTAPLRSPTSNSACSRRRESRYYSEGKSKLRPIRSISGRPSGTPQSFSPSLLLRPPPTSSGVV